MNEIIYKYRDIALILSVLGYFRGAATGMLSLAKSANFIM
jgi:hypothetical protein